ncbi:uncharacterized protein LOC109836828 isoform X2 [Asparagus officinalis]|uniref:uncharacterized protein LOC109836828 isoform X2 n=1 Tax=Asparagus officinalis TaxID=4686 RepID=UPI00098E2E88|nr:uncharacterized protein LOC109836828 isoform X2 [Asparagus officinalis]
MLLRSSSTPILGTLLSSSSSNESPNHHHHGPLDKATSLPSSSFSHPPKPSFSFHSSPNQDPSTLGFRRAQSDGNLHSLLSSDHKSNPALDTIPSFSMYSSIGQEECCDEEEEEEDQFDEEGASAGFSFVGQSQNLNLVGDSRDNVGSSSALPLFLARGLGIDRLGSGLLSAGGGGGGRGNGSVSNGYGGGGSDIEVYYKRMVDENPSNALFLSNYAQFLYQTKGDAQRAEEYYSRAILAEPGDGEILSQYAKLVWELHRDIERASSYFEQAVRASPSDSHVLGAYASFLWETEDNGGDGEDVDSQEYLGAPVLREVLA